MTRTNNDTLASRIIRLTMVLFVAAVILALSPNVYRPAIDIKYLITAIAATVCAAAWGHDALRGRVRVNWSSPLTMSLTVFLVAHLVSALASNYRVLSVTSLRDYVCLGLIYIACAHAYREAKHAWPPLISAVVATSLASLYAFVQKAGYDPFPWAALDSPEYLGLPATLGNPNYAAHVLVMSIVMSVGLAMRNRMRWCLLPAGLMFTHLALTGYRSAFVSLGGMLFVLFMAWHYTRRGASPQAAIGKTAIAFAMSAIVAIGAGMLASRAITGHFLPLDSSILIRYNAYASASRMITSQPVLGYGFQAYSFENPPFWTPFEQRWFALDRIINLHVHNDALESAIDGGLLAAFAYFGIILSGAIMSLWTAIRIQNRNRGDSGKDRTILAWLISAVLIVFGIDGLFGFNLHTPAAAGLFILTLGLCEGVLGRVATPSRPAEASRRTSGRMAFAAVAVLGISIPCLILEARSYQAERHYHAGLAAAQFNAPEQAVDHMAQAYALVPWEGLYPLRIGQNLYTSRQYEPALRFYMQSVELMPNFLMAHVALARAALKAIVETEQTPAAVAALLDLVLNSGAHCLKLCPMLPEAHEILGNAHMLEALGSRGTPKTRDEIINHWKTAQIHYQAALRNGYAGLAEVQKRLAQASIGLGDIPAAERYLRLTARKAPGDEELWEIYYGFASQYGHVESLAEAIEEAIAALGPPTDATHALRVQLYLRLANVYQGLKRDKEERRAILREALELAPGRLDVWGVLASLRDDSDLFQTLRREFDELRMKWKLRDQAPPPELARLEELFRLDGRWDRAADTLQRICAERVELAASEDLAKEFAWIAHGIGQHVASMTSSPESQALAQRNLGLVFAMCGQWPQADTYLGRAQEQLPSEYRMTNLIQHADVLTQMQRSAEALELAQRAYALDPRSVHAIQTLARKYALAGRLAEARETYTGLLKSTDLDPDRRELVERELAQIESALGARP